MNTKEYIRISKLSLNSRKKSTKTTVSGLSFGLSLIMPLLFMAVAVFTSLVGIFNDNKSALNYTVKIIDSSYPYEFNSNELGIGNLLGNENQQKFLKLNVNQKIVYNEIINNSRQLNFVIVGNKEIGSENGKITIAPKTFSRYDKSTEKYVKENYNLAKSVMLDYDLSQNFAGITPNNYSYADDNIFLPGYDKGFTGDKLGQVVVAEVYLQSLGIKPEEAYLKPLTINFSDSFNGFYDDDTDPTNYFHKEDSSHQSFNFNFITEFLIVGIIKESVTKNEAILACEAGKSTGYMDSVMFFSKNSLKNEVGEYNSPYFSSFKEYDIRSDMYFNYNLATYPVMPYLLNEPVRGKMILGAENFSLYNSYWVMEGKQNNYTKTNIRVVCDDFYNFYNVGNDIKKFNLGRDINLTTIVTELSGRGVGQIFDFMSMYLILMCVFGVVGLILLSSALINIFNIIAHSIHIRTNYLGVMQAIGLKKKGIIKLYMCEVFVIFKQALKQIFIFGGLICSGIVFAINMSYIKIENTYFTISGIIIIPAFLLISAFLCLSGYAIVMTCCGKVKKKNIPQMLKNEQN